MKGLESLPIKLLLVCFLLLIVVSVGMSQMSVFMGFKEEKDFKEDLTGMVQSMKLIKSSGDYGAVTSAYLSVPLEYDVTIDLDRDRVTGGMGGRNITVDMGGFAINITAVRLGSPSVTRSGNITLVGGSDYDMRLYYGFLGDLEMKEYTILFI